MRDYENVLFPYCEEKTVDGCSCRSFRPHVSQNLELTDIPTCPQRCVVSNWRFHGGNRDTHTVYICRIEARDM